MAFETIIVELEDHVSLIKLNRPDALNALNDQLLGELVVALNEAQENEKVRCIVITGSEKAFAAGADIKEMQSKSYMDAYMEDFITVHWERIASCRKPTVAAVAGYALGGGCEVAMMCDIVIAADTAKFGQPEIKIGCIPGIGGTQRLTRLIGRARAMDMILTGRMIDASEALRIGLVSRLFEDDALADEAHAIAATIASFAKDITMMAKACVNQADETALHAGLKYERQMYHALYGLPAQREGMAAFAEKRPPRFRPMPEPGDGVDLGRRGPGRQIDRAGGLGDLGGGSGGDAVVAG